jgi:hypothetical protein
LVTKALPLHTFAQSHGLQKLKRICKKIKNQKSKKNEKFEKFALKINFKA